MVNEQVTTVTLAAGTPSTVEFSGAYPYYWIDNKSDSDVYASLGTPKAGIDGTYTIAAGSQLRISGGAFNTKLTLLGGGKVQVIASSIASCPFKVAQGGGGCAVAGASYYTLNNAVEYPLLGLNLYGKSTQDGTPTPENPVDIVSVGDSGSVAVQACGKNLFDYRLIPSKTDNGVTCTNNNDGTFTFSGSKTNISRGFHAAATLTHEQSLELFGAGTYTISGVPSNLNGNLYAYVNLYYNGKWHNSVMSTRQDYNNPTYEIRSEYLVDDYKVDYGFYISANQDLATGTYFIQIEQGSTATDFEPYKGNIASITSALPLCGIPVSEGGNYTDSNGQQWACDELIYNADGSGKVVKHTGKITYDGSDDEIWGRAPTGTTDKPQFITVLSNIYPITNGAIVPNMFCDKYAVVSPNYTWKLVRGISTSKQSTGKTVIYIYDGDANNDLTTFKTMLAANPVTVVYQLAEPQEIELTAAEMAALRELQTYSGITNISNDSGADMDVSYCTNKMLSKYVMPITTGLQKQIDELKAAVLSLGGNV